MTAKNNAVNAAAIVCLAVMDCSCLSQIHLKESMHGRACARPCISRLEHVTDAQVVAVVVGRAGLALDVELHDYVLMRPVVEAEIFLLLLAGARIAGLVVPDVVAREDTELGRELERGFDVPAGLLVASDGLRSRAVEIPARVQRPQPERPARERGVGL